VRRSRARRQDELQRIAIAASPGAARGCTTGASRQHRRAWRSIRPIGASRESGRAGVAGRGGGAGHRPVLCPASSAKSFFGLRLRLGAVPAVAPILAQGA